MLKSGHCSELLANGMMLQWYDSIGKTWATLQQLFHWAITISLSLIYEIVIAR
jgi:hypothetical protein